MDEIRIIDWFRGLLTGRRDHDFLDKELAQEFDKAYKDYAVRELALRTVISYIAATISKCEFKTFRSGLEVRDDEYYRWNVEPNVNENASQFITKWLTQLFWSNEALIVEADGQLLVADSFIIKQEYALFPNVFTGVSANSFSFQRDFAMDDVLYSKLSDENITRVIGAMYESYKTMIDRAVKYYSRSRSERGIVTLDGTMGSDEREAVTKMLGERFKGYFENDNAIVLLPSGYSYDASGGQRSGVKQVSDAGELRTLINDVLDLTAIALRVPPLLIRGAQADIGDAVKNYMTFCIDPLAEMLANEINRKIYGRSRYLKGDYIKIDTSHTQHVELFDLAAPIDKLLSSGFSPNEIRKELDRPQVNEEWADKHWITRNYQELGSLNGAPQIGGDV